MALWGFRAGKFEEDGLSSGGIFSHARTRRGWEVEVPLLVSHGFVMWRCPHESCLHSLCEPDDWYVTTVVSTCAGGLDMCERWHRVTLFLVTLFQRCISVLGVKALGLALARNLANRTTVLCYYQYFLLHLSTRFVHNSIFINTKTLKRGNTLLYDTKRGRDTCGGWGGGVV
jgi:hypothetical protein